MMDTMRVLTCKQCGRIAPAMVYVYEGSPPELTGAETTCCRSVAIYAAVHEAVHLQAEYTRAVRAFR
jgi:hypothetical protein